MFVPRQQYPRELKIALMREIDSGKSTAWVARNYQLSPKRLEVWKVNGGRKGNWRFLAPVLVGSLSPSIQATRFLTFTSVGLPPTEHISFLFLDVPELDTQPTYPLSTLHCVPRGSSARLEAEQIASPFS